ncbi:hypothetical protein EZV73_07245 [Acidaminobacter sp. JC074]|uniref:hypothetical protein n=1 Tax=Acidaminobacter sp. JC074 TaxID=2530199 RepID=UPI001F0EBCB5|nr:hypothetical protein [Acidaminobacter sp. JC074]MCH4887360.1 hypothetical protein [Acidaminobacter sp. JC074]
MFNYLFIRLKNKRGELGIGTIVSVAIAIIVAGFVLIPGMRGFAQMVLDSMDAWWQNTVQTSIFPTT